MIIAWVRAYLLMGPSFPNSSALFGESVSCSRSVAMTVPTEPLGCEIRGTVDTDGLFRSGAADGLGVVGSSSLGHGLTYPMASSVMRLDVGASSSAFAFGSGAEAAAAVAAAGSGAQAAEAEAAEAEAAAAVAAAGSGAARLAAVGVPARDRARPRAGLP